MAIKLTTTRQAAKDNGIKALVYGMPGTGKTSLAATFGNIPVVVISAEAGLLSLRGHDIPVIEITSVADINDAYRFLSETEEGAQFKAIVIDSISELAETLLASEKSKTKDGRAAYGNTNEMMMEVMRAFRDLPGRHVLFIAKLEKQKDEMTGAIMFAPSMPGARLGQAIPYLTDEVFAMRVEKDSDGNSVRMLQTQPDFQWTAKDRSGALSQWEAPNMQELINKVIG
jgi:phage nucleotide-binding protein